jgi:hypothetical protein
MPKRRDGKGEMDVSPSGHNSEGRGERKSGLGPVTP